MNRDESFWAKVDRSGDCWLWTGAKNRLGYGVLRRWVGGKGKNFLAHRYALAQIGSDAGQLHVDHICHTPACVNPAHLRPVTNKQNHEHLKGANANSKSGIRGVSWSSERRKWVGSVRHEYRTQSKRFATRAEAEAWVIETRLRLFTHNDMDRAS